MHFPILKYDNYFSKNLLDNLVVLSNDDDNQVVSGKHWSLGG